MAKVNNNRQMRPRRDASVPSPYQEARDELFQHIMQCGVIGCHPVDQKEWFDATLQYLRLVPELLDFYGQRVNCRERFDYYVRKLRVIDGMIDSQLLSKSKPNVILFGSASFTPSFGRGHPAGPRKLLIARLRLTCSKGQNQWKRPRCDLINVNEANSSQVCPRCHSRMKQGYSHWQLKHCQHADGRCVRRWQRDYAACFNILQVAVQTSILGQRPQWARRRPAGHAQRQGRRAPGAP